MTKILKKYKHAVIATDVVIFTVDENKLKVLLISMKKAPFSGKLAIPGGLVLGDESIDQGAERILREKAGIENVYLEQLYTFGKVDRDPFGRVVSVAYFALLPNTHVQLKTTTEYSGIGWYDARNLRGLAYDHDEVLRTAIERLKNKIEYTNVVYSLLPKEFTLTELQKVYEVILDRRLDKRNFRKKLQETKMLKKLAKKQKDSAHRPAELYSFVKKTITRVQML